MEHSFHEVTAPVIVAAPRIEAQFLVRIARMRLWAEKGLRLPDVDVRFVMTKTAAENDRVPVVHEPVYYADDTEPKIQDGDIPIVFVLLNQGEYNLCSDVLRGCCRMVGIDGDNMETFVRETMIYRRGNEIVDIHADLSSFEEGQEEAENE